MSNPPLGGPPPDAGGLAKLNDNAAKGDAGAPKGGAVLPCNWRLEVNVKNFETFWPGKDLKVLVHPNEEGKAAAHTAVVTRNAAKAGFSTIAQFSGVGAKAYKVTAKTLEDGWVVVDQHQAILDVPFHAADVAAPHKKEVQLHIRNPLYVSMQLQFKMPAEAKELNLPKDFVFKVKADDTDYITDPGGSTEFKLAEKGRVKFEVPRKYSHFTLEMHPGADKYISFPDPKSSDTTLKGAADLDGLRKDEKKYFRVPAQWLLKESDWQCGHRTYIAADNKFKTKDNGAPILKIGTEAAPVKMILDPHWHFLRFEFFDRYYGHDKHAHKRINIPQMPIDGYRDAAANAATPDTTSYWVKPGKDDATTVHCLPWILQRKADGTKDPKPDKNIRLEFKTAPNTYIHSDSDTVRKVQKLDPGGTPADADALKPSADRLKYYDLPAHWQSDNYYTRIKLATGDKGEFFDEVVKSKEDWIKGSNLPDKALIFSLDDVVLTDETLAPINVDAKDRLALFFHRFKEDASAGATTKIGLWKPDAGTKQSYYTEGLKAGPNAYIHTYPNWIRLAVAQSNLFDVFDKRTATPSKVVGARAGVRWVDVVKDAWKATVKVDPRPVASKKDFFTVQPLFYQEYNGTWNQYKNPPTQVSIIGRFDLANLRCCDHVGDIEQFVNLHFFRFLYDFRARPTISVVELTKLTTTDMDVKWKTDVNASHTFFFGSNPDGSGAETNDDTLQTDHSVAQTALDPGKQYYFKLEGSDAAGVAGTAGVFAVRMPPPDPNLPPTVSNVAVHYTDKDAKLLWTTDRPTTTRGGWGTDAAATKGINATALTTNHQWWLKSLAPDTDVFFKLEAKDAKGNTSLAGFQFKTEKKTPLNPVVLDFATLPTVSNLTLSDATDKEIKVNYVTAEKSETRIRYSKNATFGTPFDGGNDVTNHQAHLKGLTLNEIYNFRIEAETKGGIKALLGDFKLNTTSPLKPVASKPSPYVDSPYHPAGYDATPARKQYMEDASMNLAHRFNGYDTVSKTRTELLPQDKTKKIHGDVLYFIQPQTLEKESHFKLAIVGGRGRNWMNSQDGLGELAEKSSSPESDYTAGSYTGAHETGHGGSLPDEYSESSGVYSHNHLGIRCNLPGDPFLDDGIFPFDAPYANGFLCLMNDAMEIRNRYAWHSAEFARAAAGTPPLLVKNSDFHEYKVPPHAKAPIRNYAYWPISEAIDQGRGGHGKFDAVLYAAGKDRFVEKLLPGAPYQGILIVLVKMAIEVVGNPAADTDVIVAVLRSAGLSLNEKFYAKGKVLEGTADEWTFTKCWFRISPRVIVRFAADYNPAPPPGAWGTVHEANFNDATYQTLDTDVGVHFKVRVSDGADGVVEGFQGGAPETVNLVENFADPNFQNNLLNKCKAYFARMVGLKDYKAATTPANWKSTVKLVMPTTYDVAKM